MWGTGATISCEEVCFSCCYCGGLCNDIFPLGSHVDPLRSLSSESFSPGSGHCVGCGASNSGGGSLLILGSSGFTQTLNLSSVVFRNSSVSTIGNGGENASMGVRSSRRASLWWCGVPFMSHCACASIRLTGSPIFISFWGILHRGRWSAPVIAYFCFLLIALVLLLDGGASRLSEGDW